LTVQIVLFLACTILFWTSNVTRMISWIPLLGRNGLINQALQRLHLISQPLEWLLFSEFAVVLAFVHLSAWLGLVVMVLTVTVVLSLLAGLAYESTSLAPRRSSSSLSPA
jgi:putative spermidine/putrescine transport system permease protein